MQIPVFDLNRQNEMLEPLLNKSFTDVLRHGHFILGDEVREFEDQMTEFMEVKSAIGVANGSDALALALLALGIKAGDEVIVPSFTFFATAGSISRIGATPVFVDVSLEDYNIDPMQVRAKISSRTRAMIPVHLFGMPADMDALTKIAQEFELAIIEDVAQALGSTYKGKMVGTMGDIGCLSFFPTKNLGCLGDGGMVVTHRPDIAEQLRMLRVHGARKKYFHQMLGINSRLDTIQAAFLKQKLPFLNQWIQARRQIASFYYQGLADIADIGLPLRSEGHTYNQFTIRVQERDSLQNYLSEQGIGTTIYYPLALHMQPVFHPLGYTGNALPNSELLSKQVLSLPIFPELTEEEQMYIVEKIRKFYGKRN